MRGMIRMNAERLLDDLADKTKIDTLVSAVVHDPSLLDALLEIVAKNKGSIKYSCTKVIKLASEKSPEVVYPYFDQIGTLLQSENSFVKWDAICILSNLVKADQLSKFDLIFDDYFQLIKGPQMITAANVIGNVWKIIHAKPHYEADLTSMLLEVPGIIYFHQGEPSPECNNIVCGYVIECFDKYFAVSGMQQEMIGFAKEQLKSTRKAVAVKAKRFLSKHNESHDR